MITINEVVNNALKNRKDYILGLQPKLKEIILREIKNSNKIITFDNVCEWQKELYTYKVNTINNIISSFDDFIGIDKDLQARIKHFKKQIINLGLTKKTNDSIFPIYIDTFCNDLEDELSFIDTNDVKEKLKDLYNNIQSNQLLEDYNDTIAIIIINIISYTYTNEYIIL